MPISHTKRQLNKKRSDSKQAQWSDKQKFNAVTAYLLAGTLPATSAVTGVPLDTLKKWKASPWWKKYEEDIRASRSINKTAKLETIIQKSLDAIEDRLDKGDILYNPKAQRIERVPINAKNANQIMKDATDKQILLDNLRQNLKPSDATNKDIIARLEVLKEQFRKFTNEKKAPKTYEGSFERLPDQTEDLVPSTMGEIEIQADTEDQQDLTPYPEETNNAVV